MKTTAMKTLYAMILTMAITATHSFAAAGNAGADGWSLMTILFVGFVSVIIVFQLVPAMVLLAGMVKALVSATNKDEATDASGQKH